MAAVRRHTPTTNPLESGNTPAGNITSDRWCTHAISKRYQTFISPSFTRIVYTFFFTLSNESEREARNPRHKSVSLSGENRAID